MSNPNPRILRNAVTRWSIAGFLLTSSTGCVIVPNPWKDSFCDQPAATTASVRAAFVADTTYEQTSRGYTDMTRTVSAPKGVLHGPTYFEDPFLDRETDDGKFAWTGGDLLYAVYGPGRFGVNFFAAPVSMVVNPPWQIMQSDGLSAEGDARRFDAIPAGKARTQAEANNYNPDGQPDVPASDAASVAG